MLYFNERSESDGVKHLKKETKRAYLLNAGEVAIEERNKESLTTICREGGTVMPPIHRTFHHHEIRRSLIAQKF